MATSRTVTNGDGRASRDRETMRVVVRMLHTLIYRRPHSVPPREGRHMTDV